MHNFRIFPAHDVELKIDPTQPFYELIAACVENNK